MSIEKITQKEWLKYYHEMMDEGAKQLTEAIDNYTTIMKVYEKHRIENKTYRINYYIDDDTLMYKIGTKRRIGFNRK